MDQDDLYSGYDDTAPTSPGGGGMSGFATSPTPPGSWSPTSSLRPPPGTAAMRGGTAMRLGTAAGGEARPMTSNRGAGFSSSPQRSRFDPLGQAAGASAGGLASSGLLAGGRRQDASVEEQARALEKQVHALLEESAACCARGEQAMGLERALEARRKERQLCRLREQNGLADSIQPELTYAVELGLAAAYQANQLHAEALDMYGAIVRAKLVPQASRLRINMGNIYYELRKYSAAIKMWRMALDQLPAAARDLRGKVLRNIGLAFVRLGQYQDALQAFESVVESAADHQAAYNLLVCCYAMGDRERMRRAFTRLVELHAAAAAAAADSGGEDPEGGEEEHGSGGGGAGGAEGADDEELEHSQGQDELREEQRRRHSSRSRDILNAARLVAEKVDRGSYAAGYDWCCAQLRSAGLPRLANEVELAKASRHLAGMEFGAAIAVYKGFERREARVKARAATCLSFLALQEGDLKGAAAHSDLAVRADSYNARALVNKAAALVEGDKLEAALGCLQQALRLEPLCVEALYDMGLVQLRLGEPDAALSVFKKLHGLLPDSPEVLQQLAACCEAAGDLEAAVQWLEVAASVVPNDAGVMVRLGALHARLDDEARALHYYSEAHRLWPVDLDVISWLGAHHVRGEVYERAVPYFELAALVQPQEPKWALMVASCFRRIGALPQALARYKQVHAAHPTNVECLRYLVHLCSELGRRDDAQEYAARLKRAERLQASVQQAAATTQQQSQERPQSGAQQARQQALSPVAAVDGEGGGMSMLDLAISGSGKRVQAREQASAGGSKQGAAAGHDEWGNEELGEDLLPL